jgi:hypothetical protein
VHDITLTLSSPISIDDSSTPRTFYAALRGEAGANAVNNAFALLCLELEFTVTRIAQG